MEELDKSGLFSMRRVVRETGLSADTLRAWEDRYGLPEPQRSKAGHRLYSLHDIEVVKWMLNRKAEGIRPSQAARLFQDMTTAGEDPLAGLPFTANPTDKLTQLEAIREGWIQTCLKFDEPGVTRLLAQAFAQFTPADVILGVLVAGMNQIGQGWLAGQVSVAQEHFATEVGTRKVELYMAALPPATRPERILVACPPGERHAFPALVTAYLLAQAGWQVIYFGADLPTDELNTVVRQSRLDFAILAGTSLATAPELANMLRTLQALRVPAGYGGYVYSLNPTLREIMPGHYLGDGLKRIADQMPAWLMKGQALVNVELDTMDEFLSNFMARRSQLEHNLMQVLGVNNGEQEQLLALITTFLDNVKASALLGDFELLVPEVDWLGEYLRANEEFSFTPKEFLLALDKLVVDYLDDRSRPFSLWLNEQTARF